MAQVIPADSYDGYVPASLLAPGAPSVVLPIVGGAAIAKGLWKTYPRPPRLARVIPAGTVLFPRLEL